MKQTPPKVVYYNSNLLIFLTQTQKYPINHNNPKIDVTSKIFFKENNQHPPPQSILIIKIYIYIFFQNTTPKKIP